MQVEDAGQELRGMLVPESRKSIELLGPLVVGQICLLHHKLLDGGVRVWF